MKKERPISIFRIFLVLFLYHDLCWYYGIYCNYEPAINSIKIYNDEKEAMEDLFWLAYKYLEDTDDTQGNTKIIPMGNKLYFMGEESKEQDMGAMQDESIHTPAQENQEDKRNAAYRKLCSGLDCHKYDADHERKDNKTVVPYSYWCDICYDLKSEDKVCANFQDAKEQKAAKCLLCSQKCEIKGDSTTGGNNSGESTVATANCYCDSCRTKCKTCCNNSKQLLGELTRFNNLVKKQNLNNIFQKIYNGANDTTITNIINILDLYGSGNLIELSTDHYQTFVEIQQSQTSNISSKAKTSGIAPKTKTPRISHKTTWRTHTEILILPFS